MKPLRLPPGFKFNPSDSDLILRYLTKKINGEALPIVNLIQDRDLYDEEGLVVQVQQQEPLVFAPAAPLPQLDNVQPQCVWDNEKVVDDWLCAPTDNECGNGSISSSYPWHSEGEFFQYDHQGYTSDSSFDNYQLHIPSEDGCNMASTSYPLSPIR
ncbi:hypothetical protein FRX31_018621 [Thalictrum thalictroides]|uniref:NAC domain-containing protein n=1 Tax=Thalictrum thalictroides TaxID=46969 RepID=A0A7J6W346_THATH|nr:hypothetical protein FRX31_018621 [Thalictrum thalictroides]